MTGQDHRVKGVDHAAFPTFDPARTVRFYRDVLGFPVVHSICAAGWGPENHPDFIHFFLAHTTFAVCFRVLLLLRHRALG